MSKEVQYEESGKVGEVLRYWRELRKLSQMDLALQTNISSKHISFIETGKSQPSRELLRRIAASLKLPFRQLNALLLAAGYAPEIGHTSLDSSEMKIVKQTLERILNQQEPYPAIVVNGSYDILQSNNGFKDLVAWYAGTKTLDKYTNIYRLVFAEDGLKPFFRDWEAIQYHLLERLFGESIATQNAELINLYKDIAKLKTAVESTNLKQEIKAPVLSFTLIKKDKPANFFSTITSFGTPLDVTTQELRIESIFPADEETAKLFRHFSSI